MRLANWLEDALGSRAKVRVLRYLCRSARDEHTLSEISRSLKIGLSSARLALQDLEAQGYVESRSFGNAHGYRMYRGDVETALRRIFAAERLIGSNLEKAVRTAVPATCAALLFGSAAREEQTPRSDLDLLVMGPTKAAAERASLAAANAIAAVGPLRARTISLSWAQARAKRREPWFQNAIKEGRVLAGPPPETWF